MKNGLIIDEYGTKRWYKNGLLHREDGPAVEDVINGIKRWYKDDKIHREDGPASIHPDGTKFWYLNNQIHREDGPAIECRDGSKSWWINGRKINCKTQKQFEKLMKLKAFW